MGVQGIEPYSDLYFVLTLWSIKPHPFNLLSARLPTFTLILQTDKRRIRVSLCLLTFRFLPYGKLTKRGMGVTRNRTLLSMKGKID